MTILTDHNQVQDVLQQEFVLIIAKSHTCTACKTIYETLERNIPNLGKVDAYSVFVDDMTKFRGDQLIFAVPTILIFSEGKELLRESRYINYDKITRLIDMFTT